MHKASYALRICNILLAKKHVQYYSIVLRFVEPLYVKRVATYFVCHKGISV